MRTSTTKCVVLRGLTCCVLSTKIVNGWIISMAFSRNVCFCSQLSSYSEEVCAIGTVGKVLCICKSPTYAYRTPNSPPTPLPPPPFPCFSHLRIRQVQNLDVCIFGCSSSTMDLAFPKNKYHTLSKVQTLEMIKKHKNSVRC